MQQETSRSCRLMRATVTQGQLGAAVSRWTAGNAAQSGSDKQLPKHLSSEHCCPTRTLYMQISSPCSVRATHAVSQAAFSVSGCTGLAARSLSGSPL